VTRKRDLRQGVRPEDRDLEHLGAGAYRRAVPKPPSVCDSNDRRRLNLGDVIRPEQLDQLHRSADLLATFPHRRRRRVFVVIDESARQAPQSVSRFDRTPAKNDSAIGFDHHRGRHLRVAPEHEVVVRTGLDLASFDDLDDELRAAVDAEVTHQV